MLFSKDNKANRAIIGRAAFVAVLFIAVLFAVMLVLRLNSSLGWFASNLNVSADGMAIAASSDQYIIYIERTARYDETLAAGNKPLYDGISDLKTKLASNESLYGYSLTANSTQDVDKLAYEIVNEVTDKADANNDNIDEVYYYLSPGSCGTVTFYLKPKSNEDIVANLELSIGCFVNEYEGNNKVVKEVTNETVLNLLKGHILFFSERSGVGYDDYIYSGFLADGMFTYDTSQNTKSSKTGFTDCYEITLYWEWPRTYSDIVDNISSQGETAKRYPNDLGSFMNANRGCFLANYINSNDIDELNDGYNDGDQVIGEKANYIVAFIIPHGQ
ncbi:MAG: hypothetical protein IJT49_10025 [Clostridia bacterium]|nr:hypothetical protein [Clostridia bacterium]